MVAPLIGGFIVTSHLGWRWTQYISGIMCALALVLNVFLLRESYVPVILTNKAKRLRQQTKNWAIHSKLEETEVSLKDVLYRYFMRPLHMLVVEPIVFLMRYVHQRYACPRLIACELLIIGSQSLRGIHLRTSLSFLDSLLLHLSGRLSYETWCKRTP